jgi:pyridoxamine 5'-phosphate oxidase
MSKLQPVRSTLYEVEAPSDPLVLFTAWLNEAQAAENVYEHNAFTLASATLEGKPSARVLLLRGYDQRGFCFYTNYASRKGEELAVNPQVALVWWWGALGRQIRVEGQIEVLTAAESDAYFHSRSLGSRLSALVSPQSQVIASRAQLEAEQQSLTARYADQPPPRPAWWGGYRVQPTLIEFWQSGQQRLHDRLRYTRRAENDWLLERLAP